MDKWNIKSKRFLIVGVMSMAWIALLVAKEVIAVQLAPYAYALVAAYCGFDTWRGSQTG
jgi:threonine dehydrogenase-like Zn-dependent dehydrogenase